jgi:hypothetical protein
VSSNTWRVLRRLSAAAVGNDGDLQIVGDTHDVFRTVSAKKAFAKATLGTGYEDLRYLGAASEFDHGLRDILAANDLRFDAKVASEAKVLFDGRAFGGRKVR